MNEPSQDQAEDADLRNAVLGDLPPPPAPRKRKVVQKSDGEFEREVRGFMAVVKNKQEEKCDAYDRFGQYVAETLRDMEPSKRAVSQLKIQQLLIQDAYNLDIRFEE